MLQSTSSDNIHRPRLTIRNAITRSVFQFTCDVAASLRLHICKTVYFCLKVTASLQSAPYGHHIRPNHLSVMRRAADSQLCRWWPSDEVTICVGQVFMNSSRRRRLAGEDLSVTTDGQETKEEAVKLGKPFWVSPSARVTHRRPPMLNFRNVAHYIWLMTFVLTRLNWI